MGNFDIFNKKPKTQRILYPDILRVLATLAVITIHVCVTQWGKFAQNSHEWQIFNFYNGISRWCVPIFIMISGMFLLDFKRYSDNISENFEKILLKNISKILVVLIFWSIFYKYFSMYMIGKFDTNPIKILDFLFGVTYYHLWFLYLILGLYILAPFLQILVKNLDKSSFELLLIILSFFGCGLLFLNIFSKFFLNQTFYFPIAEFNGFVIYFFAGYYFANFEISNKAKFILYFLAILSLVAIVGLNYFFAVHSLGKTKALLLDYKLLTTMFSSFGIFIFIKNIFISFHGSSLFGKLIQSLSKLSLGIYVIHACVIAIITKKFSITTTTLDPIFMVPLMTFAVFTISAILAFIVSKIPILKKVV